MKQEVLEAIEALKNELPSGKEELEAFRLKYLSKKGIIQSFFTRFRGGAFSISPVCSANANIARTELK